MVAATKAFLEGGLKALAFRAAALGAVGGLVGATIADAKDRGQPSVGKNGLALGLTDRRLLAFGLSAMTGSPKELIGELPLSRIRSLESGEKKVMAMKTATITFALDDGSTQTWEIPKASAKDGERLLAELRARLPVAG